MQRRKFIETVSMITAAGILPTSMLHHQISKMKNIGIQLFSLPKLLSDDFKMGIEILAQMGYNNIELYGPYTFSAQSTKDSWKAIEPMLGFNGSGFFGYTSEEVKSILKEHRISTHSAHTDIVTLEENMEALGEAGELLGYDYVVLPAIPPEMRTDLDAYKRMADRFNKIGQEAKKVGLKYAYHNHGYGLQEKNGVVPFEILVESTDKDLVFLEMDIFWTAAGGADPIMYLNKYKDRYKLMHLKDMSEEKQFSGDGGDPSQWIALFPYMSTCGQGVFDLDSIISTAKKVGVKHFFVEQDMVANPKIALKESFDFLSKL